MFIPLGHNCHPTGNLIKLNLRKQSFPFDWLLCDGERRFEYINNLINTNFSNFTANLVYNERGKVISKHYEYVEFYHHDLIKNVSDIRDNGIFEKSETLIQAMHRRGKRFMDIISNESNEIVFLYILHHTKLIKDGSINNNKLYQDMVHFDTNLNIKCRFKVLVYLYNDNEDYDLIIPHELYNLKHFIFDKYIRNKNICKIYGDYKDFVQLLIKNKLLH